MSVLIAGLTIFFVKNKSNTIYASSITANKTEIDMFVGDEIYIMQTINFGIEPANCTQPLKFSVSDIFVCSLDSGTRKIKAKNAGTCTLRASVKSAESKFVSTDILIRVFEIDEATEVYATNITKRKDNVVLKIGESIDFEHIFEIFPQNCTQKPTFLFDLPNICQFDNGQSKLIATGEGICIATVNIKSGENETDFVTNQINIVVCENQSAYNFEKNLTFESDKENKFVINITEDLPQLYGLGKIEFETVFDQNCLEIDENEANIYKILCKSVGVFEMIFENSGFCITYTLTATAPNLLLQTTLKSNAMALQVGDAFDLTELEFENLPSENQIEFSLSNQNANVQNSILTATNVGEIVLTVIVTSGENQKQFEIGIIVSKRMVNYQVSASKHQEQIEIDLFADEVVRAIAPTFDLQSIIIENEEVIMKDSLSGSILTVWVLSKGNTSISISTNKVDIIISVSVG